MFLFSIVALLGFFPLAQALGLSAEFGGLWAGLAVNDLSSSVAVGSQFGDSAEVLAAASKSVRILLLGPLLVFFSLLRNQDASHGEGRWFQHMPLFILGYLALFGVRLAGDAHFGADEAWSEFLSYNSSTVKFLILGVCAGIGLQFAWTPCRGVRAALAGGLEAVACALSLAMLYGFQEHGVALAWEYCLACNSVVLSEAKRELRPI